MQLSKLVLAIGALAMTAEAGQCVYTLPLGWLFKIPIQGQNCGAPPVQNGGSGPSNPSAAVNPPTPGKNTAFLQIHIKPCCLF